MEVEVYIEPDEGVPRTERIETDGRLTIGRHSQCSLYLEGDRISRMHLLVEIRPERLWLEDRSSNGTLVGEQLLHRDTVEVPYATPVVVGGYTLMIKPPGAAGSTREASPASGAPPHDPQRMTDSNGIPIPAPITIPPNLLPPLSALPPLTPPPVAPSPMAPPGMAPLLMPPPAMAPPLATPAGITPPLVPPPGMVGGGIQVASNQPALRPPPPPPMGPRGHLIVEPEHIDPAHLTSDTNPVLLTATKSPSGRPIAPPARPPPPPPPRKTGRPPAHAAGSAQHQSGQAGKAGAPQQMLHDKVILAGGIKARLHDGRVPAVSVPEMSAAAIVAQKNANDEQAALRREIHAKLLENLDLAKLDGAKLDDPSMRPRVLVALRRIVLQFASRLDPNVDRDALVGDLADEALGLGPLERFLSDPTVSEIMVVDPSTIFIEQGGKLVKADARFTDDERVRAVIERIVTPLGRRIDESSPLVDARLKDGSRVNAVIKPLALRGSCITIRKFSKVPLTVEKLVGFGALTERMARFLDRSVVAKKNIIISGGTGSGKTTLLNVLSSAIPFDERIVTIEDAAELQLIQPHVVGLESRPPNMEGRGEYTIRDLVRNALRMRPDRIVVGECRGGEALDMLQAMNTGHDGSLTTTHANSPIEAIARIETLALMGGLDLPSRAIREQIAGSIHLVVQQTRFSDGSRRISAISEVIGIEDDGQISMRPIFEFVRTGTGSNGKVLGEHRATGYLPSFLDAFIVNGLVRPGEPYL